MKKIISIMLAALMLLGCVASFASCQDKGGMVFGKELLTVGSQLDALNGLLKGDADIAVIDSVMAGYYMNETDTFKDYQVLPGVVLAEEQYGIGAKKGNNALIGKINEALIALVATDYQTVAQTYGLSTELLVKVFDHGKQVYELPSLESIRAHCKEEVEGMWDEVRRFSNPHNYYVDLSQKLWDIKNDMLKARGVYQPKES